MRLVTIGTLLTASLLAISTLSQATKAQHEDKFPTRTIGEFANAVPGYCWYNQLVLDQISQHITRDLTLIVISRLGAKEKRTDLGRRRLHNTRAYLTHEQLERFRRSPDSIIIAEGERTDGRPRIEFYIQGRLIDVLIPHYNHDLLVTGCYDGIDGGETCSTPDQRKFYPCKGQSIKKRGRVIKRKKQ